MISVSNLAKSFGDRTLFAGASFQLNPAERYGLVGANGSGKTTLLRILSGDLAPDGGTVSVAKRLRLGVLRQDQFIHDEQEILGLALQGNPELSATTRCCTVSTSRSSAAIASPSWGRTASANRPS